MGPRSKDLSTKLEKMGNEQLLTYRKCDQHARSA